MKGLLVFVLRSVDGDGSNRGVTSTHDKFVLTWDKSDAEIFEPSESAPELQLVIRCGRFVAIPVADPRLKDGRFAGPMFGGNFVYTSDSRFPNDYPIPVHDRFETVETTNHLSAETTDDRERGY